MAHRPRFWKEQALKHKYITTGLMVWLDDICIQKRMYGKLHGELLERMRWFHKKNLRNGSKTVLKSHRHDSKCNPNWEELTCYRNNWSKHMNEGWWSFHTNSITWAMTRRVSCKKELVDPSAPQFMWQSMLDKYRSFIAICKAMLMSHQKNTILSINKLLHMCRVCQSV